MSRTPEVHLPQPDVTLKMHVGDMPEELRPYAFGLHAQITNLLGEMGVVSVTELERRIKENARDFLPHVGRVRQIQELLPKLHEVLSAPKEYLAERKREGAPEWLQHVAEAIEALPPSGDDASDRIERRLLDMRLQQANEDVLGTPLTDLTLVTWMAEADPEDFVHQVAREAADIAIDKKRYSLVLGAFSPEAAEFGDPIPALVYAMMNDGRLAEAEAIIQRMPTGEKGNNRQYAYFSLAKALRAKGKPWKNAYDAGVASYTISGTGATRAQARTSLVTTHAKMLGALGDGEAAARMFESIVHEERESDIYWTIYDMVQSGEYAAAVAFMDATDVSADMRRKTIASIGMHAVGAHAPDADLYIAETERVFAETEDTDTRKAIAEQLSSIYAKSQQWEKIDALIPVMIPDEQEQGLFRHAAQFLLGEEAGSAPRDISGLPSLFRYTQEHPEIVHADEIFSSITTYFLSQGDLTEAALWRSRIKDPAQDPWHAYFDYALHSGDVRGARAVFDATAKRDSQNYRLTFAIKDLLLAYVKAGDSDAFVAFLKHIPVEKDEREKKHRREHGVRAVQEVMKQARDAVKPVV